MNLVPLLLNVKSANAIILLLVSEQNILKSLPHPFTGSLAPNGNIDISDMTDTNQSRSQVVKPETCLDEVGAFVHVFRF
jgi:hypothetical protein